MASTSKTYPPLGALLREWRGARRMSQLQMAMECGISTRHLGFVELGKSRASRETVARFADALDLPLRERNALLLAAGYAPQFQETGLGAPTLERMRGAVELILRHHEPFPAFVLNRHFDLLMANEAAARVNHLVMGGRESRHSNLLRQIFDPEDFRPFIANWPEVASSFLKRLHHELAINPGDARGRALLEELLHYPDVPAEWRRYRPDPLAEPVLTLVFQGPDGPLRFFETITTFAAPFDVTLDDLRIDCAFPVDAQTAEACAQLARAVPTPRT